MSSNLSHFQAVSCSFRVVLLPVPLPYSRTVCPSALTPVYGKVDINYAAGSWQLIGQQQKQPSWITARSAATWLWQANILSSMRAIILIYAQVQFLYGCVCVSLCVCACYALFAAGKININCKNCQSQRQKIKRECNEKRSKSKGNSNTRTCCASSLTNTHTHTVQVCVCVFCAQ